MGAALGYGAARRPLDWGSLPGRTVAVVHSTRTDVTAAVVHSTRIDVTVAAVHSPGTDVKTDTLSPQCVVGVITSPS